MDRRFGFVKLQQLPVFLPSLAVSPRSGRAIGPPTGQVLLMVQKSGENHLLSMKPYEKLEKNSISTGGAVNFDHHQQ